MIRHTGFFVNDIFKSMRFFSDLGFNVIYDENEWWDNENLHIVKMENENSVIELLQSKNNENENNKKSKTHVAITVKDLDSIYKKYKDEIKFEAEPILSADKKVMVVFCREYNDIRIELVEELK